MVGTRMVNQSRLIANYLDYILRITLTECVRAEA